MIKVMIADDQELIRESLKVVLDMNPDMEVVGTAENGKEVMSFVGSKQPDVILMDEPFVGLDPVASHLLKGMMRELCDQGGAIFFSTHVLEVAEKLCDKIAIIRNGKLVRSGTMEEVKGDESLEDVFLELVED